ncbi:hypothetical protein TanjilG_11726 [Lupinus angustifolius]|uniref:Uncharacterized protein n=2 Tax=Lupinus angustifolius TaxID=3871 RepID=A0A1J7GZI8_LUPAN|nr:hypothetical protein TanjilG_11726 [Lupinus angustifolius]
MKANLYSLRSQKMELDRNVLELQSTMDSLKDEQKVMESAFEETQNELRIMQQKSIGLGDSETIALKENLKQKEAKIKDLKEHLEIQFKSRTISINDSSIFPETVTVNTTMAAEYKTVNVTIEKDEHSGDSAKYGGGAKHIINEVASKSKSTIKDGVFTIELQDEIQNDEKHIKKNEHPQDDGGTGVTEKDIKAEVVEVGEKKVIKEEQPIQLKGIADGGGQHFNVKQLEDNPSAAGVKRKHSHLISRTKTKRWRTIVKNSLMENNVIPENHKEVNKGNIMVSGDEKDEVKDRTMGIVYEANVIREDKERGNNNQKQEEGHVKLLKPET